MRFWTNIVHDRLEGLKFDVEDLISILLPVYNSQLILPECLNSILAQTHHRFEVVAIDDGSTDDTPALLSAYSNKDSRIKVYRFEENRGIVEALNFGLEKCRGPWVARMDADDIMMPERLKIQLSYLAKHPKIDLLGAQVRIFRQDKALTSGQHRYQDWSNSLTTDQSIKAEIYAESPIMHPTFFLTKLFYQRMGGYRSNPWAEDYDFILRAFLKNATFAKIPEVLVAKRDSPTRLARTDVRCKRKAMFNAKAHYFSKSDLERKGKRVLITGTGSSGRKAYAALRKNNVSVHGFVDNTPGDQNRTVCGLPAETLNSETADRFFSEHRDCFFILCIGALDGLEKVKSLLSKYHLQSGKDYVRFI